MITPPKAIQDPVSPNLSQLQDQLASARDALEEALKKNQNLEEQLAWLKNQVFGRKSEKFIKPNPNVLYLPGLEPTQETQPTNESPSNPKKSEKNGNRPSRMQLHFRQILK